MKITKTIVLLSAPLLLFSCAGEDMEAEAFNEPLVTANITTSEMYGTWNLNKLDADTLVDLNGDDVWNMNLREETTCFDKMSITFNEDGTYSSINARMDFKGGETNDQFVCMDYSATPSTGIWSVDGNILTMTITVDGVVYKHEKELTIGENSFSFEVTRLESQQYYEDPGDTAASRVNIVYSTYVR